MLSVSPTWPDIALLLKILSPDHVNVTMEFDTYHPPLFTSRENERVNLLCHCLGSAMLYHGRAEFSAFRVIVCVEAQALDTGSPTGSLLAYAMRGMVW